MPYIMTLIILSGTFLSATDDQPEGGDGLLSAFKRGVTWVAKKMADEDSSTPTSPNNDPLSTFPLGEQQPAMCTDLLPPRPAAHGGIMRITLHGASTFSHQAGVGATSLMQEAITRVTNDTAQAQPPVVVVPTPPPAPMPVQEPWKTYQLEGTQLALVTWADEDRTLTPFYQEAFRAFWEAALNPTGVNRTEATKTPKLDELIQFMDTTLHNCSQEQSTNFRAQTDVTSLQESRHVSTTLLERYKGMQKTFVKHFDVVHNMAALLHKAIQHDQKVCEESQKRILPHTPKEMLVTIKALVASTQQNIAQHKRMLVDILSLLRAMYPAETSGWECVDAVDESTPSTSVEAPPQQTTTSLKEVLGIDVLPLDTKLAIPDAATKEVHYLDFLRQILGTPAWVLEEAKAKGRMTWVVDAAA